MVKLFRMYSNVCDHNPSTLQTDGRTDGQTERQTTCDRNTALCTKVHSAVKTVQFLKNIMALLSCERQQNWLRVVTVVFRTIGNGIYVITSTFLLFYVFSKSKKSWFFTFFCRVSYVFSNYGDYLHKESSIDLLDTGVNLRLFRIIWGIIR